MNILFLHCLLVFKNMIDCVLKFNLDKQPIKSCFSFYASNVVLLVKLIRWTLIYLPNMMAVIQWMSGLFMSQQPDNLLAIILLFCKLLANPYEFVHFCLLTPKWLFKVDLYAYFFSKKFVFIQFASYEFIWNCQLVK